MVDTGPRTRLFAASAVLHVVLIYVMCEEVAYARATVDLKLCYTLPRALLGLITVRSVVCKPVGEGSAYQQQVEDDK